MASRNIDREIICEHKKECKSYSVWVGDGKNSKCRNCKNNEYQDPKKDYYEADTPTKIANIIITVFGLGFLVWFGYCLFNIPIS